MASKAAKRGIKAEERLIDAINSKDELGKKLIKAMEDFLSSKFTSCYSCKSAPRTKSDITVTYNGRRILISVKEFDVKADYNHVERDYVDFYAQKWSMPQQVYTALKKFVGEVNGKGSPVSIETLEREAELLGTSPGKLSKKRRIFINQMDSQTREIMIEFFRLNKAKILKDVFIDGEDIEFFIVVKREDDEMYYYVVPTKDVQDTYSTGDITITARGSLQIGKVVLQRKGGDHRTNGGWADITASHLQFKIRPSECIKNRVPIAHETIHP